MARFTAVALRRKAFSTLIIGMPSKPSEKLSTNLPPYHQLAFKFSLYRVGKKSSRNSLLVLSSRQVLARRLRINDFTELVSMCFQARLCQYRLCRS